MTKLTLSEGLILMTRTLKFKLLAGAALALPMFVGGANAQSAAPQGQAPTQVSRMATCNADAKTQSLAGDARKAFMSECLSGKVTQTAPAAKTASASVPAAKPVTPAPAVAQQAPAASKQVPVVAALPAKPAPIASGTPVTAAVGAPIDVNNATAEQLDGLWGVGKVRASAIIANRPYKTLEDFHARHVVPENVFARIKDQIVAR
jgi:DNA uptake protein ComE-like DNA-binding protein